MVKWVGASALPHGLDERRVHLVEEHALLGELLADVLPARADEDVLQVHPRELHLERDLEFVGASWSRPKIRVNGIIEYALRLSLL